MIAILNDSMRYYLSPYPTDMRKSFYILGSVAKDLMGQDVRYRIQVLLAEYNRLFQKFIKIFLYNSLVACCIYRE